MKRCHYLWVGLLIGCSGAALASQACPPNPCMAKDRSGVGACEPVADWVVEGTVVKVNNGSQQFCHSFVGIGIKCSDVWVGYYQLAQVSWTKGAPTNEGEIAHLMGGHFCWVNLARIPDQWLQRRVRAYGTKTSRPFGRPGIFAVELLPDQPSTQ